MRKIIPGSPIAIICLAFVSCNSSKSNLPATLEDGMEITYRHNGDMTPDYIIATFKNDSLFYIEKKDYQKPDEIPRIEWQFPVEKEDMEMIYKLFVTNKIDLIKNKTASITRHDAGYDELSIFIKGKKLCDVTYGSNTPLSSNDAKRFTTVVDEIRKFAKRY